MLDGLIPPLVTPLTAEGEIDEESFERQLRHLAKSGVSGFWVNGSSGEFHALTDNQRNRTTEIAVSVSKENNLVTIAQVGAPSTRTACQLASHAAKTGANAVAALTPYYLEYEEEEIDTYYTAIRKSSELPVLIYHVPQFSGTTLKVPFVQRLFAEDKIIGIKDSAGDLAWFRTLLSATSSLKSDFATFVGGSLHADVALYMGASGLMCAIANLIPRHCARILEAAFQEDWILAQHLQRGINDLVAATVLPERNTWAPTVAVFKFLLNEIGVISTDLCAHPLSPLNNAEKQKLIDYALPLIDKMENTIDALSESNRHRQGDKSGMLPLHHHGTT